MIDEGKKKKAKYKTAVAVELGSGDTVAFIKSPYKFTKIFTIRLTR